MYIHRAVTGLCSLVHDGRWSTTFTLTAGLELKAHRLHRGNERDTQALTVLSLRDYIADPAIHAMNLQSDRHALRVCDRSAVRELGHDFEPFWGQFLTLFLQLCTRAMRHALLTLTHARADRVLIGAAIRCYARFTGPIQVVRGTSYIAAYVASTMQSVVMIFECTVTSTLFGPFLSLFPLILDNKGVFFSRTLFN